VALAVALVGYWVLLRWVPVPGAGMPGQDFPFMDQTQNMVSWLDRLLLKGHLYLDWSGPNAHSVRDPEGLLSDLPAIGTALIGLLTGLWLRGTETAKTKAAGLASAALGCLCLGYLWSFSFPLNKNMWTSSYVLVAAGYSLSLLTLVFVLVDVKGWRKGWTFPWLVFGSNAIMAYMISELLPGAVGLIPITSGGRHNDVLGYVFTHVFAHIPDGGWAAFAYAVTYTAVCFAPVWVLYRKKIFVKV
jgi:predicted acyltransferase